MVGAANELRGLVPRDQGAYREQVLALLAARLPQSAQEYARHGQAMSIGRSGQRNEHGAPDKGLS
jgi:hypothetical protein